MGYRRFRKIVTNLILATDIATPERGRIVKNRYENVFGDKTSENKKLSQKKSNPSPLPSPRDNPLPSRRKELVQEAKRRRNSKTSTTSNSLDSWMELKNETDWINVGGGGERGALLKKGSSHSHTSLSLWG